jgi:ABC-type Fe3+ transport system permease subunit
MNWTLLGNSLTLATLATALAVGLGLAVALFLMGLDRRWRVGLLILAAVALVLPGFLVANGWIHLFGVAGIWRPGLPVNIYSMGGAVSMLGLLLWPIPLFFLLGAWQRLEAPHLESDPLLTGPVLVARLLVPLARDALSTAAIVTFVLALNNFAIPALLQVRVYPSEVWISFNTHLDAGAAFRQSWPLIAAPLLLLLWFRKRPVAWPATQGSVPPLVFRRSLGKQLVRVSGAITVVTLLLALAFPLGDLLIDPRTWRELSSAVRAGQDAIANSFVFAATTATLTIALGLGTWRRHPGPWLWFPFLVPGVLLGLLLIVTLNRPPFLGFYRGIGIVLLAWTIRYLAIGWTGVAQAMRSVDTDLLDAAQLEGASAWQQFRHVSLPQVGAWFGATWLIVYLLCLWDVETLVLISPPGTETLAARIFGFLHYGHNAQVNALCLTLLGLAILPIVAWSAWRATAPQPRARDDHA